MTADACFSEGKCAKQVVRMEIEELIGPTFDVPQSRAQDCVEKLSTHSTGTVVIGLPTRPRRSGLTMESSESAIPTQKMGSTAQRTTKQ
jgi:hypothetical protein